MGKLDVLFGVSELLLSKYYDREEVVVREVSSTKEITFYRSTKWTKDRPTSLACLLAAKSWISSASLEGGEGSKVSGPRWVTLDGSSCREGDGKLAIFTVRSSALAPSLADMSFQ